MKQQFIKFKKLLIGVFPICICQALLGQTDLPSLPSIIPSSPNAAELGRYATLDIGLQTGTLNYKIPIFNISAAGINIPIDIQYATSGIKVDQIASRCGMGWVLNAGGMIMRNMNGKQDEISTRAPLPSDWSSLNTGFLTYLKNVTNPSSGLDTEPDEFVYNFNGYNGKFVLDGSGQPVLMPYNNLKVQVNGSPNYSEISINTPDGCTYHFNAVEFSTNQSVCYGNPLQPVDRMSTAWYLTQIVLPNAETVSFSYDDCAFSYYAGISQTISSSDNQANLSNLCSTCPIFNHQSVCASVVECEGKMLRSIVYGTTTILFDYIGRQDIKAPSDPRLNADKLLSKIRVWSNEQPIKSYSLNYETAIASTAFQSIYGTYPELKYRPFLKELSEKDSAGTLVNKHQFIYHDINGMPPRLSYAQDLWGYFNGKFNSGFVPRPELAYEQQLFPNATANRDPVLQTTSIGALIKIIYPTGGSDSIIYELNNYRYSYLCPPPRESKSAAIQRRPDYPYSVSSAAFTPYNSQNIRIVGGAIIATGSDGSSDIDPDTPVLDVEVIRQSDNQKVFARILKASDHLDELVSGLTTSDSYVLKITSLYPNIKCSVGISYETGPAYTAYTNKDVGGLRVAKTVHTENNKQTVKRYFYSNLNELSSSSGSIGPVFKNILPENSIVYCQQGWSDPGTPGPLEYFECKNWTASSSSLVNIYRYGQNHIYYSSVIESDGNNFENGGVAHSYILDPDRLSKPLFGKFLLLGVRTSNTGILNGLENGKYIFRKEGNGLILVKRIANYYKVDSRVNKVVDAYFIKKNYDYLGPESTPPLGSQFDGFEVHKYGFYSKWAYLDSTVVYSYNPDDTLYAVEKTAYKHNNLSNISVTQTEKTNSKLQTVRTKYLYPNDMVNIAGADPSGVYQKMVNKHIINPVTDQASFLVEGSSITPLRRIINNYWNPLGAVYAVKSVLFQHAANPVDTLFKMNVYDSHGHILEQQLSDNVKEVYLWGYNHEYPVAKITGSNYTTVVGQIANLQSQINAATAMPNNDANVRNLLGGLRTAFAGNKTVQVFTYTYRPLIGMTSETDPAGRTIYYEYDGFGRLKLQKDDQGKVLKSYCYNYAGQPVNCN